MKRKLLAAILAGMMVLCLLPTSFSSIAMAEEVILISDRDDLESISDGGSYRLTADIDLSGGVWEPLSAFSGKLDGGGHVISGLSIADTIQNDCGLFASISAGGEVFDLGIAGASITAKDRVGGIAGKNNGAIRRCFTTGTVIGNQYVGGLAGTNSGIIENCYSRASVNGTEYLGGLVGSNSGTVTNCYAASAVTDSVKNNFLEFNGSSGFIKIPGNAAYNGDAFTLEAWFQWDGSNDDGKATDIDFIIGKGFEQFEIHTEGGSGENGLRFIPIPHGEHIYYGASLPSGGYKGDSYIDVHNVFTTDSWYHVAAVYWYDSTEKEAHAQVYVNGEAQDLYQIATSTDAVGDTATIKRDANPIVPNTTPINIGRRTNETYYFEGKIADVRFWNTRRTGDEIKDNMDRVLTGNEAGLVGYWRLNEAEGVAIDSSITGNNGTLNSGVERITVSGTAANRGALAGLNTGTVTNCPYDSTLYGSQTGGAGTAKTTSEMKKQDIYTGWDFSTIWKMSSNDGYPCFRAISAVTVHSGTTDKPIATEGETVTITADTLDGQLFKEWTGVGGLTFADGTDAASSAAKFIMPAGPVEVTATYEAVPEEDTPVMTPPSDSDDSDPPAERTVYNDPSIPQADIWLTGKGLAANDLLITDTLTSGEKYNAMLRLAEGGQVLKVCDIYLQSGKKSTGNAMHITFDLSANYAGQKFTLVHIKSNGVYEYFYATANSGGDLTFGPLYSLSPFMLVKGTLASEINPATGYGAPSPLWMGMLISGSVLTAIYAVTRRKDF